MLKFFYNSIIVLVIAYGVGFVLGFFALLAFAIIVLARGL